MTARPDVDALRKALEASTRGAWMSPPTTSVLGRGIVAAPTGMVIAMGVSEDANAEFIARAHNDLPAILDYIEQLEAERTQLKSLCGRAAHELGFATHGQPYPEGVDYLIQELRAVAGGEEERE